MATWFIPASTTQCVKMVSELSLSPSLSGSYASSAKVSSLMLAEASHLMVFFQVELAEICTKSERYIGTEGGGMDQSISFLAEEGTVCESL